MWLNNFNHTIMKLKFSLTLFFGLSILLFQNNSILAQSRGFNYQAVARDLEGNIISNENINLKFSVINNENSGPVLYQESFLLETNSYGQINAVLGKGTVNSGDWDEIDWTLSSHFLVIEMNGNIIDTTEFEAVPYSKMSEVSLRTSGMSITDLKDVELQSLDSAQSLQWNGENWVNAHQETGPISLSLSSLNDVSISSPVSSQVLQWNGTEWSNSNYKPGLWTLIDQNAIYNQGRIGIGISDPKSLIHVKASSVANIRFTNDNSGDTDSDGFWFGINDEVAWVWNHEPTDMRIGTNSVENLRLTSTGRVGIGTTDPATSLHINHITGTAAQGLSISNTPTNRWQLYVSENNNLFFYYNEVLRAAIDFETGDYINQSDRNMKKNIESLNPVLSKIMHLKPVLYHFNNQDDDENRTIGLIAQEAIHQFPELTTKINGEHDSYGINYSGYSVVAIKGLQEQQKMIEEKNAEIDALNKRLDELELRLAQIEELLISDQK